MRRGRRAAGGRSQTHLAIAADRVAGGEDLRAGGTLREPLAHEFAYAALLVCVGLN